MTNQEEIRAIIQGHATRDDIYNHDQGEEFDKAEITLRALQKYGDELLPALLDALSEPDETVRRVAMRLLGEMDTEDESVLPAMIGLLEDSNRSIRLAAARFVTRFGEKAKSSIPVLKTWIGCEDRYSHVTALGTILWIDQSEADSLIPLLIDALEFDGLEQWQAIIQLESLGELALPAVPALERLVDEGDTTISWQSSDAIFEITGDDSSVIKVGKRLLNDPDELIRVVGVEHLMQLGKSVMPTLEKVAVEDESDLVRNRAVSALDEIVK
ncbi:MAG: HEAT repeat domain-containing protein [Planctomycetota bacterium]|nr:HEAT repeat domain-containing protein [Planctomycetota bacterium]